MAMSCASESFLFPLVTASGLERKTNVCFMNSFVDASHKLRPVSIIWVDPREDSKFRTSNVTKFASCSANGLLPEDLFLRDDLIESTSDCLARVAKTIIALVKWAETPVHTHNSCAEEAPST